MRVWLAFLLACTLSASVSWCFGDKWRQDYLDDDMYFWTTGQAYCVRLLTRFNRTGCASIPDGKETQLRYVSKVADIYELDTHVGSENKDFAIGIVLPLTLLSQELFDALLSNRRVKGVIFTQSDSHSETELTPPSSDSVGFSADWPSPVAHLKPNSQRHSSEDYTWNPSGTGLMNAEFPFSMIILWPSQSAKVKKWAKQNEDDIADGNFGRYFAEFNYRMHPKDDSDKCLRDDDCLPVGGYSVWSSFEQIRNESQREYVFGMTSMDSVCLMHQHLCRGADSSMSGLTALLSAALALSGIKEEIYQLDKQILLAAFNGESFDLMGSRKFTFDLNGGFECKEPMDSYSTGCWNPYSTNLDFLNLNFSRISTVIELNQIGIGRQSDEDSNQVPLRRLYAHYERNDVDSITQDRNDALIEAVQLIAKDIAEDSEIEYDVFRADPMNNYLPGTPPSSFWSFLHWNPQLSGIVLTDYNLTFNNKWYHSVFDSYYQDYFDGSSDSSDSSSSDSSETNSNDKVTNPIDTEQICLSATLFARSLFQSADSSGLFNETFLKERINVDCDFVTSLFRCLTQNMQCDIVKSVYSGAQTAFPSHYSGVYAIREDLDIGGTTKFVFRFLANATSRNETSSTMNDDSKKHSIALNKHCSNNNDCLTSRVNNTQVCGALKKCVRSETSLHAALDPTITFDYGSDKQFRVLESDARLDGYNLSYAWTESTWKSQIGTRFYQKEDPQTGMVLLIVGLLLFISSMLGSHFLSQFVFEYFKKSHL